MLYGVVLRDYPKQVVSLIKVESVPANMRESLSLGHKDSAALTQQLPHHSSKRASRHMLFRVQADAKLAEVRKCISSGSRARSCDTVRKDERHPQRQDPATCSHRHTDHRESNAHTRKTYCVDCGTYINSVPREIFNAIEATRSASSNRNEELADRVSRDTTITKRQLDLATRMMLEQVSRLSDGDYKKVNNASIFPGLR